MDNPFKEYQVIELAEEVNPILKKGMRGVILLIHDHTTVEVEFLKEDGTNYEYEGQFTFTLRNSDLLSVQTYIYSPKRDSPTAFHTMDILDDVIEKKRKLISKKAAIFFLAYMPVSLLLFYVCSPIFLKIWNNEIGNQFPAGPFLLGFVMLLLCLGLIVLKMLRALNWMTILMIIAEFLIICGGILYLMVVLTL